MNNFLINLLALSLLALDGASGRLVSHLSTSTFNIPFSVDPNVVYGPDSLTVLEFDSFMLTCTFTGNPSPYITWEREGMDSLSNETKSRLTINETSILNFNIYTVAKI